MDKIQKAINKLNLKEKKLVKEIIKNLLSSKFLGLNIQKLRGHKDIYRVRKGSLRVIYRQTSEDIFVLAIERRSEKTYRAF
jgi:mRNA-degrading endonuclease RelE of RelBE toxin-antitoxin system